MKTLFWGLANIVMAVHFAITGVIILCAAMGWFYDPWYIIPLLSLVILIMVSQWLYGSECPLALLEESLRRKYDGTFTLNRSFTAHYLGRLTGMPLTRRQTDTMLRGLYIVLFLGSLISFVA